MRYALLVTVALVLNVTLAHAGDAGWPRTHSSGPYTITVFQPQVDAWPDHTHLTFRMAVAVAPTGTTSNSYGVLTGSATTHVNWQNRTVLLADTQFKPATFPGASADDAAKFAQAVTGVLPKSNGVELSLDRLLANVQRGTEQQRPMEVNLDPPPIFYSTSPTLLVVFTGEPAFQPVVGTDLLFAANTNWPVFRAEGSGQYYLLDQNAWMTAPDLKAGPWTGTTDLPAAFSSLPPPTQQ